MQIIDELELAKRGPYGGGIGHVSFTGGMDMALALRTMVIPTAATDTFYKYGPDRSRREWVVHLQAGAGLVADSVRTSPKCNAMSTCHDKKDLSAAGCSEVFRLTNGRCQTVSARQLPTIAFASFCCPRKPFLLLESGSCSAPAGCN